MGRSAGVGPLLRAYFALTKPRIIELLLVTTVPTMILAAGGWPEPGTAVATLVGGALAAAGANTLNSYLDRDIDEVMSRTKHRPLVTGAVTPRAALTFGLVLSVLSVAFMAATTNLVAAVLTAVSIAFYVVVYTMLLKRRTAQNIVWGGAAGCMPVLIGWAAVTGSLAWPALVLFLIIFFWTPPHYWPLSLRFRDDYASARVPMLPVVADRRQVGRQIVAYSWVMVAVSLLLVPVAPMGWVYTTAAVLLGGWFLWQAHALLRRVVAGAEPRPMRLFHGSITYLSLLFLAVALDPLLT
jgi:protoheme IX farnesyltransferase